MSTSTLRPRAPDILLRKDWIGRAEAIAGKLDQISKSIRQCEEFLQSIPGTMSHTHGQLEWDASVRRIDLIARGCPLIECKAGERLEAFPDLEPLVEMVLTDAEKRAGK